MNEILYILLAASIGYAVAKALRLPHVPLLILAGGCLDFFNVPIDLGFARDGLLLGLTFLVFLSGTALNPWRGAGNSLALIVGASQFFLIGFAGLGASLLMGFSPTESLYVALGLASSSTLVVIKILQTRGELFAPFGRLMVGALLVQDLLIMLVISALSNIGEGLVSMGMSISLMLCLTLLGLIFKKWIAPWILLSKGVDEELQLVLALGVLFVFMGCANLFGLPFLTGAFVAGISLSSFPVNGILKGQLASLNNFFSAVFFVMLGFFVDFPLHNLDKVLWLSLLVITLTPLLSSALSLATGMTLRTGAELGLLLAQTSEFSIILALIGMDNGDIGQEHLSLITSVTVVTMTLTPFLSSESLASALMRLLGSFARKKEIAKAFSDHYVIVGCGDSAMIVLKKLLLSGVDVVVIDDDAGVIRKVREMGAQAILGNGKDPEVLKQGSLGSAKLVISSMRKFSDNKAVLGYARNTPKVIRVFDQREADEFERLGAISIPSTDASTEDLLEWIEKRIKHQS